MDKQIRTLLLGLTDPGGRLTAARDLSRAIGSDSIIVFVMDKALGMALPAPGFAPTLPGGALWRAFLAACTTRGEATDELPFPIASKLTRVSGIAGEDGSVFVVVGGSATVEDAAVIRAYLPFVGAAVRSEWVAEAAQGFATAARDTADQARLLTDSLDATRRELTVALTQAQEERTWIEFLAEATTLLSASLDLEQTLTSLATLSVPRLADICIIDMFETDGAIRRVTAVHAREDKHALTLELRKRTPTLDGKDPTGTCLCEGRSELVPRHDEKYISDVAEDDQHRRLMVELGYRSHMAVPLRTPTKTLGCLTFITTGARELGAKDLAIAEDLARRASLATENARLHGDVREANRRKDEFLATLAHELRNPLAPISTAVHLISSRAGDPVALSGLSSLIERQVQHLSRLVDDLLDVSRITRGKIELRKERVNFSALGARAVESIRPLLEQRNHTIEVSLPEKPVWIDADPARILQVLVNLLTNAAKYTDPGGRIALTVALEDDRAVARLRDNGIGIPPGMRDAIFELFVQAHTTLAHSEGGLGIGLTLVKNLVKLHGGTVEALSEGERRGSEFIVRLPACDAPGSFKKSGSFERFALDRRTTRPRRVLVVDDNSDATSMMQQLLELWGFTVQVECDGAKALAAALSFLPATVLLDIGLPGQDGYQIAHAIRKEKTLNGVVIVALTGYGQAEDRRRTKEAGFDHHLVKPVDIDTLERLLAV